MRIETKAANQLSTFERARTDCVVTSSLYSYQMGTKWVNADWMVMVWEDDELVSNVHIIERDARVGWAGWATLPPRWSGAGAAIPVRP